MSGTLGEPLSPGSPESTAAASARVRAGMRRRHNWIQLVKFCAVGASGYVINLSVFTLAFGVAGVHHLVAATLAFAVAVSNNFWWNRHWTFAARDGRAGFQAARFLAVSAAAFVLAAGLLELLISVADFPEIGAQAVSIAAATPFNFIGNKMWSFGAASRGL